MRLHHAAAPQGSPEWFMSRLGRVTASEAASVLAQGRTKGSEAVTRRDYRMQLVVERLTGTPQSDSFESPALAHGTLYEPQARQMFEVVSGETVQSSGFWYAEDRMVGASLDAHIRRDDVELAEVVEIKCPYKTANHLTTLREQAIPSQYIPQVTHQLWLTGAAGIHFCSYDPRLPAALQLAWIYQPREQFDIDAYAAAVEVFLAEVDRDVAEWTAKMRS